MTCFSVCAALDRYSVTGIFFYPGLVQPITFTPIGLEEIKSEKSRIFGLKLNSFHKKCTVPNLTFFFVFDHVCQSTFTFIFLFTLIIVVLIFKIPLEDPDSL